MKLNNMLGMVGNLINNKYVVQLNKKQLPITDTCQQLSWTECSLAALCFQIPVRYQNNISC